MWIKLFGGGVLLLMVICIIWLPGNLSAGIALARGENAEKARNYFTAEVELKKAEKQVPNAVEVLTHLTIAAFYNQDLTTVDSTLHALRGQLVDDSDTYSRVSDVINEMNEYNMPDALEAKLKTYKNGVVPDSVYVNYLHKNPMSVFAFFSLASAYITRSQPQPADSCLTRCLTIDPEFIPAIELKTSVKRQLNQSDSSLYYCDKLLADNNQSLFGLSSKSRTLMEMGELKQGLKLAEECSALDEKMRYNIATLAIAYHLNRDYKKRDEMIKIAEKDSTAAVYMGVAKDVISGKEKL